MDSQTQDVNTSTTAQQAAAAVREHLLGLQCHQEIRAFVRQVDSLASRVDKVCFLANELRAAENIAGTARPGPTIKGDAATYILGKLTALRPDLPFVSVDATAAASAHLLALSVSDEESGEA